MEATLLARAKEVRDDGTIIEVVIWALETPLVPCAHNYKYRLYFGKPGECFVRYDNEPGKGDHRHYGEHESPYRFSTIEALLADFGQDIENWGLLREGDH